MPQRRLGKIALKVLMSPFCSYSKKLVNFFAKDAFTSEMRGK